MRRLHNKAPDHPRPATSAQAAPSDVVMFSYATFEDEQSKQHAADLLSSPSAVLRQCVHDNVSPHRLRLQLLKVCLRAFAPRCAQIEPASGCVSSIILR